jgi:carboxymethylenebutenolidase
VSVLLLANQSLMLLEFLPQVENRIPFTSVVRIRGDRLYHEHSAWDQATVLIQLGLLPEYLPSPHHLLPDGRQPGPGNRFEFIVPASGVETVAKMLGRIR